MVYVSLVILCTVISSVYANEYDFAIQNNTTIEYTTGKDIVNVKTEYIREVKNNGYFYSTQGEKVFHIPDLPKSKQYELELERQFKLDTLKVTDNNGNEIKYTTEKLEYGEGIYVKVPNYKQTTYGYPYVVFLEYQTHDLVKRIYDHVVLLAPALHEDTQFEQTDASTGTKTSFSYDLQIVTDKNIQPLANIYPSTFVKEEKENINIYSFDSKSRNGVSPYLEFGTSQIYRFELKYTTPKTDSLIPEKYSSVLNALSTNIYEFSLPREFAETNQKVKISEMIPKPTKISQDSEGNIVASFEVPANKSSAISISGYIYVKQDEYGNRPVLPNYSLNEYLDLVKKDINLNRYLSSSKFWEVSDPYIQGEAKKIYESSTTFVELLRNDYRYINERLEYDESKANSNNERIGAKAALQGGGSVCMEYADSMIALLRAQGIPSRAALGYSNLDILEKTNEDGSTRHQWVQVWVPEYGWLSIDPTYESENMLIGQNIEKVLWETFFDDELSNIKIYSADTLEEEDFSDYSVKIYAVSQEPNPDTLLDYSDIKSVSDDDGSTKDTLNKIVKTTTLGKSVVIMLPIFVILGVLIVILTGTTSLIKKIKARKAHQG